MPTAINGSIYLTITDRTNLKLLSKGLTDKEIAAHRERSLQTIKNEVHDLRLKFNAQNRLELVLNALRTGQLVLD